MLSLEWAQVPSLIGELRSHLPRGEAKGEGKQKRWRKTGNNTTIHQVTEIINCGHKMQYNSPIQRNAPKYESYAE